MLAEGIFEHARRCPDSVAIVDGESRITYATLARAATSVQEKLRAAHVEPGARVGITMHRSWRLVATIVGIIAHGSTYVPLDPEYPSGRTLFMAADSGIGVLCVDPGLESPIREGIQVITVDGCESRRPWTVTETPPDQPMYVIYTSGSSGQPKGVAVGERGVVALLDSAAAYFDFGPDDVWTMCHSYCFDFSVWEIWGALHHGGTLVIVPVATVHDPAALLDLLERHQVTVLNQVPSAFKHLVRVHLRRAAQLSLRYVIFGGEALDKRSVRQWLEAREGPEKLVNMYGITEITVHATYATIGLDDVTDTSQLTRIGRPLDHLRIKLCDAAGRWVSSGEPGEIYVAGDGLALGYFNLPELTEQRFPVITEEHGEVRYYRSGDLATQTADGELYYIGRIDSQVNMRGYRIELGEVESVLQRIEGISDAAVVTHRTAGDETVLVAFVIGSVAGLDHRELRRRCAEFLPSHMVPARFSFVSEFPLTPSGKLDRAALKGSD